MKNQEAVSVIAPDKLLEWEIDRAIHAILYEVPKGVAQFMKDKMPRVLTSTWPSGLNDGQYMEISVTLRETKFPKVDQITNRDTYAIKPNQPLYEKDRRDNYEKITQ